MNTFTTTSRTSQMQSVNHLNIEIQADQIINELIIQTSQEEYDEMMVEGLIRKYEQLMS